MMNYVKVNEIITLKELQEKKEEKGKGNAPVDSASFPLSGFFASENPESG
jgi:hypothetical protein